jgi:hypothetical protein
LTGVHFTIFLKKTKYQKKSPGCGACASICGGWIEISAALSLQNELANIAAWTYFQIRALPNDDWSKHILHMTPHLIQILH